MNGWMNRLGARMKGGMDGWWVSGLMDELGIDGWMDKLMGG